MTSSISASDLYLLEGAIEWHTFPQDKLSDSLAMRYKDKLNPSCLIKNSQVSVDTLITVLQSYITKRGKCVPIFKLSDFVNYGASDLEKILDSGVVQLYPTDFDAGNLEISDSIVDKYADKLPSLRHMVSKYSREHLSYSSICKLTRCVHDKLLYTRFAHVMSDHNLLLELFDVIWTNSLIHLETDNIELRDRISSYKERFSESLVHLDNFYCMLSLRDFREHIRYGIQLFKVYHIDHNTFKTMLFPLYAIKYLLGIYGINAFHRYEFHHIDVTGLADYDFELTEEMYNSKDWPKTTDVVDLDKANRELKNHIMYLHNKYDTPVFDPAMIKLYSAMSDEACLVWFKDMSADTLLEHWDLFDKGTYQPSTTRCGIYLYAHIGEDIDSRILDRIYDKTDTRNRWGCDYSYCLSAGDLLKYRSKVDWKHMIRCREFSDSEIAEYMVELRHVFNSEERWKLGHDIRRENQSIFDNNCRKFDLYSKPDTKLSITLSIPGNMSEDQVKEYLFNQYKARGK